MKTAGNPTTRNKEIVEQQLQDELLVYDLRNNNAYCLNKTAALVYQLCNGKNSVAEISRQLSRQLSQPVSEEFVWLALERLKADQLLSGSSNVGINFNGLSRREVVKRVGLASLIALPVISSLIAPLAAVAQSCIASGNSCTPNNGTQSNCCSSSDRCTNTGPGPACNACLGSGTNTNCNTGAGCCNTQLSFFSNSCCNGVTESPVAGFPGTFRCACN